MDAQHTHATEGSVYAGFAPMYAEGGYSSEARGLAIWDTSNTRLDLGPLQFNQPEVEEVGDLMGGKTFVGPAATEAAFKQLSSTRILHLAMHGIVNDKYPMYSGLAFGSGGKLESSSEPEDGFLHAYELYNMELDAELTVLSACNTGIGQLKRGEGLMSLARAFRYAGCPNLVTSLWPVNDRATFEIMQYFYSNLKSGMGKSEAIKMAKWEYLNSHPETPPHYWASFILIGDDAPIEDHLDKKGLGGCCLGWAFWQG